MRLAGLGILAALLAADLAGCASSDPARHGGISAGPRAGTSHASRHSPPQGQRPSEDTRLPADPLLDSPFQTLAECDADTALSTGDKFGDVRLVCPSLKTSATITEFRDAGWRIEELRMTEKKTPEGEITIPFAVTLRKLF